LPDRLHLHSLVYRRYFLVQKLRSEIEFVGANAKTAFYLWMLNFINLTAALLWWDNTPILVGSFIFYLFCYLWIYQKIIHF